MLSKNLVVVILKIAYNIYILYIYVSLFIFFCHHHHMECLLFSDLRIFSLYIYIYTVTPVDYTSFESKTGRTVKLLRDVRTVAFITFYQIVKFAIKAESLRNVPQLRS